MITLYGFGPAAGLPDPSPFVMKVEVLLKMAGLAYERRNGTNPAKGPKGKIPFIEDEGRVIADSTFIRLYLEEKYQADFDLNMSDAQKAVALLVEKHCEDCFYFIMSRDRWIHEENFNRGPRHIFDKIPPVLRTLIMNNVRGRIRKMLWLQGYGRHSEAELLVLFKKSIAAIATILGDQPYLGGVQPCGADATLFGFIAGFLCPHFQSVFGDAVRAHPNLVAYNNRMMAAFYPDYVSTAGAAKAA